MKKLLSYLLAALLLLTAARPAGADALLPESAHNYGPGVCEDYTCSIPGAAGMLVTFSEKTRVQPGADPSSIQVTPNALGQITLKDVLNAVNQAGRGDFIFLYDKSGSLIGSYRGDALAGRTVFVPGDELRIVLDTDDQGSDYGFRVTSAEAVSPEALATVTYHTGLLSVPSYQKIYYTGGDGTLDRGVIVNSVTKYLTGSGFTGWAATEGGRIAYDGGESVTAEMDGLQLYARWASPLLGTEEIFLFNNSARYFEVDENGGYYLTDEAMEMLERKIFSVFGPTLVPAAILGTVLYTYPTWEWRGSCYGFSTVTFLQHYGKIDLLPSQNARNMNEMQMDDDLRSTINYYQAQSATSWLCENKAGIPGTKVYAACLEDVYRTVKSGRIVMLTFYEGTALITSGHTVLVTDVYTNAKGEHIFIVYDNNHPWRYTGGMTDRFIVSADWRSAIDDYGDEVGAINWTASTEQFEAFDLRGNGSPLSWHKAWFTHKAESVTRIASLLLR